MIAFKKILNFSCLLIVLLPFFSCDSSENKVDFTAINQELKNKLSKEIATHKFQDDSLQISEKYIFYALNEHKRGKSKIVTRGYFTLFYVQNVGNDKKVNTKDDYFKLENTVRTEEAIETDSKMTLKFEVSESETLRHYKGEFLSQNFTIQFWLTDAISEYKLHFDTNYSYGRSSCMGRCKSQFVDYEVHNEIKDEKLYHSYKKKKELFKEDLTIYIKDDQLYYTLELDDSNLFQ
jgi:hypothetical protein